MAQYSKAVTIVLVALICTGACGYFLQTEHTQEMVTKYDYKGNLNPSILYSQVNDWTPYNTLKNVTGWQQVADEVVIPKAEEGVVNQYILEAAFAEYEHGVTTEVQPTQYVTKDSITFSTFGANRVFRIDHSDYGLTLQAPTANYPLNLDYPVDSDGNPLPAQVVDMRNNTVAVPQPLIYGGVNSIGTFYVPGGMGTLAHPIYYNLSIVLQTHMLDGSSAGEWIYETVPFNWFNFPTPVAHMVVHTGTTPVFVLDNTITTAVSGGVDNPEIRTKVKSDAWELSSRDFVYEGGLFYPAVQIGDIWQKEDNADGYKMSELVFLTKHGQHVYSYDYPNYDLPKSIGSASYADPYRFVEVMGTKNAFWDNSERNGIINVLCTSEMQFKFPSADPTCVMYLPKTLPYTYLYCTLDFIHQDFYCQGVVTIGDDGKGHPNTQDFTVADYHYPIEVIGPVPPYVNGMRVYAEDSGHLEPASKRIQNLRLILNSYYNTYGMTATINGESYSESYHPSESIGLIEFRTEIVGNDKIVYATHNYLFPRAGLSITYTNFKHVYDVTTGAEKSVDYNYDTMEVRGIIDSQTGQYTAPVVSKFTETTDPAVHINPDNWCNSVNTDFTLNWNQRVYDMHPVYVTGTTVSVDPKGMLWENPQMYVGYYFPEQVKGDTRVLFNSFVKYGDSLTINGQNYVVSEGKLVFTKDGKSEAHTLKGMALDFIWESDDECHVYAVFTEESNTRYPLGVLNDTTIRVPDSHNNIIIADSFSDGTSVYGTTILGAGIWYWNSGIYDVHTALEDRVGFGFLSGNSDFGLDMTSACLLMIMFMLIFTGLYYYIKQEEFELWNWVVIIGTVVLLLFIASIS